jgi:uncharacterized membrane protein
VTESRVTPARLEAISDGVIAVAITIMVLGLRPPRTGSTGELLALWPQFVIYLVSFTSLAVYWVNHRYLFGHLRRVDERVLWTNMAVLFLLSPIPFATAYAAQTGLSALSVAFFAGVMVLAGLGFGGLAFGIKAQYPPGEAPAAFSGGQQAIHFAGLSAYALAIPVAFASALASLALILAVSALYITRLTRPE